MLICNVSLNCVDKLYAKVFVRIDEGAIPKRVMFLSFQASTHVFYPPNGKLWIQGNLLP